MIIRFDRQVNLEELTQTRLIKWMLMTSSQQDHVKKLRNCIFTITVPLATKLDRMITYLDGFLSVKSYDALITWS